MNAGTPTVADLIGQYIKLRDMVELRTKAFETEGPSERDDHLLAYLEYLGGLPAGGEAVRNPSLFQESAQRLRELLTPIAAYKAAMQAIEGALAEEINRLDGQSIKTEQGTAYRSTTMSTKMADRDAFLNYLFANRAQNFLPNTVVKEAVKEYMEANKDELPPGIDVAYFHKVNIRRS